MKNLSTVVSLIFIIQFSFGQKFIYRAENGKFGFRDDIGNEVIPAKYDFVRFFSEGLAAVNIGGEYNEREGETTGGKWGFIDTTGKEVIPIKYDETDRKFLDGFVRVKRDGKWGVINRKGEEIAPFIYEETERFSERLVRVNIGGEHYGKAVVGGKYGVIDLTTGKEIVPVKYGGIYVEKFSDGLLWVHTNFECGFVDLTGKEITPLKYVCNYAYFKDGFARVQLDKWDKRKHGFIDLTGKEITPFKYDDAKDFSEGLARVELDEKWGFIDTSGSEICPLKYDEAEDFSYGVAMVKLNEKYGFIDATGQEVIPLIYDDASSFGNLGVSRVKQNEKGSFDINKEGKKVTFVKQNDEWFFIDEDGNEVKIE